MRKAMNGTACKIPTFCDCSIFAVSLSLQRKIKDYSTSIMFKVKRLKATLSATLLAAAVPLWAQQDTIHLAEVTVVSAGVSRVKNSAYNAVAVDTKGMLNTTKTLSEALAKAPGLKLRESGGVGSDMNLMLDGFSGKHVKVFIDGVPQEGVGSSFGLNNIPVNFADRIEVYKGVVPVGFGTDAIGGVINIVTNKKRRRWFVDAAYSYGSFNTHKSHVNFGQTFRSGFTYEINAFQNYSDNDYYVDAPVFDFATNSLNTKELHRVKRFNDTYHNEAVVAKVGFVGKPWADRLLLGFTYVRAALEQGRWQSYGQALWHGNRCKVFRPLDAVWVVTGEE